MSLYICEKCGCIDNTACGGNYWAVLAKSNFFKDQYANEHFLCLECTPKEFASGQIYTDAGKWHNRFPKRHWSEYGTQEELIAKAIKNELVYVNAVEFFQNKNHP